MESRGVEVEKVVWTEEKHVEFLNTMETYFVRTMLHRSGGSAFHLRLDRHLPDSSESTLDSKPRRTHNKDHKLGPPRSRSRTESRRRRRRRMKRSSSMLEEQVVPQMEENIGREGASAFDDNTTD